MFHRLPVCFLVGLQLRGDTVQSGCRLVPLPPLPFRAAQRGLAISGLRWCQLGVVHSGVWAFSVGPGHCVHSGVWAFSVGPGHFVHSGVWAFSVGPGHFVHSGVRVFCVRSVRPALVSAGCCAQRCMGI